MFLYRFGSRGVFLYCIGSRGVFLYRFGSRSVNPKLKTLILCAERGLMQIHGRLMEIRVKPKRAKGTTHLRSLCIIPVNLFKFRIYNA